MTGALTKALSGVVAVVIAPFQGATGPFDASRCRELTRRIVSAGVPAVTALGNTAEVFQLDEAERTRMLRAVAEGSDGAARIAGLAGSAADVLRSADIAAAAGYDAVMFHEPADPLTDGSGIHAYLTYLADRSPLPVVLYVRSGRLSTTAVANLATHPAVAGIKYAVSDLDALRRLITGSADCVWINGAAESQVPATAALGIRGFTSGLANVRPDLALAVHRAATTGATNTLAELLPPIIAFEKLRNRDGGRHNVSVVKQALRLSGLDVGDVRPPSMPAPPDQVAAIMARFPAPAERASGLTA
jgi:4-hydroxy-tetrahydrodipicolinate synthase